LADKEPNTAKQPSRPWSPYVAGALTGLGITLAIFVSEASFGATPFYSWISHAVYLLLTGQPLNVVDGLDRLILAPRWPHMFALGIPLGAFIAAMLFRDFKWQAVPPLWKQHFGGNALKRGIWAFIGGAIAMIGVRQAMGCPSGLGLSGMVAQSLAGFLGFGMFFVGGVILANLIYRRSANAAGGGE